MNTAAQILDIALQMKISITTAESCTGGMIAAALTDLPGSSAMFERGFVTYSNAAKVELLGVSQTTLDAYGAVSEPIAAEMARGALQNARAQNARAQIALSVTGIAGPGGSDHKPEGRVCFGLATDNKTHTETVEFGAMGRENVRSAARDHALSMILAALILNSQIAQN